MSFSYRLAVLAHGPWSERSAAAAVARFKESVTPDPESLVILLDGGPECPTVGSFMEAAVSVTSIQVGFCQATQLLWDLARDGDRDYVFWLEHDFEFERPVDLRDLAAVLDANPRLAQMGLLRHPEEHELPSLVTVDWERHDGWMEQRRYFSTNPSLMPIQMMRDNEWTLAGGCEGLQTIALRDKGYSFGVWGDGTPQIRHTGVRSGWGY